MPSKKPYSGGQPKLALARKLKWGAWALTAIVMVFVGVRGQANVSFLHGWFTAYQPPLHAALNTIAAALLILALVAVKRRSYQMHKKLMLAALGASSLFLLSYVTYHMATEPVKYRGLGWQRSLYFFILLSHIGLAALTFPFILYSFIYAVTNQLEQHRRIVRWVFPVWLYVALTGPVVYLMLRPYY